MRRKRVEDPKPGAPAWMTTFADMATLLLVFFIAMMSFSSVHETKFHDAVVSLRGALGVRTSAADLDPDSKLPAWVTGDLEHFYREIEEIRTALTTQGMADQVRLHPEQDGVTIRIATPFLFDSGEAHVLPSSGTLLADLAQALGSIDNAVRIEGHTDDMPIATEQFPSNWELSTARAVEVLRQLHRFGIAPERLSAVGFGEFHPVASNASEEGRRQNRRVDIFVEY